MNKLVNKLVIISVLIYTYFFFNLGNTIYRTNSLGTKSFNFMSLVEGFIGPIRTLLLLMYHQGMSSAIFYFKSEFFRLSNPYSALFFTYYIHKILQINF